MFAVNVKVNFSRLWKIDFSLVLIIVHRLNFLIVYCNNCPRVELAKSKLLKSEFTMQESFLLSTVRYGSRLNQTKETECFYFNIFSFRKMRKYLRRWNSFKSREKNRNGFVRVINSMRKENLSKWYC